MEFRILGPLEIDGPFGPISIPAAKKRALLAALLLHPREVLSRERLIDELWGESPPPTAVKALQTYVSELRTVLGDGTIVTRPPGYEIAVDPATVDAGRFVASVQRAREGAEAGDTVGALDGYQQALAIWRGPALVDVVLKSFARNEAESLDQLRLEAITERVDLELALGRHRAVVGELKTLVAQHPLREGLCGQLMLALYGSGRQSEALEVFRELRGRLDRELGLAPGRKLHELQRAILNGEPTLEPATRELPRASPPASDAPRAHSPWPRRRLLSTRRVAAAAVTAAAALAALWLGFDRGSVARSAVTSNSALVVDSHGDIGTEFHVGAAPAHALWSGAYLWTSNERDGTVSRVDAANRTVATVAVGRSPEGLAYADRQLWVANGGDGTIVAIDPTADKVVRTVHVGNGPLGLAGRGSRVWVANSVDGTLSTVDTRSGTVVRTIPVGPVPTSVAVSNDAVWVALAGSGEVAKLDRDGRRLLQTVNVGNDPSALAVVGRRVWVANTEDRTLSRIDSAGGVVDATLQVGGPPVGLAAGGGTVWATTANGRLLRIDPRSARILRATLLGGRPAAVAAVGQHAWVAMLATPSAHRGGTLRLETDDLSDCGCVDPLEPVTQTGSEVTDLLYDGLIAYRRVGGPAGAALVADLAQRVPRPSADGRTYVFQLRRGIRFSNGALVRARDVRASLIRAFAVRHVDLFPLYSRIVGAAECASAGRCDVSHGIVADDTTRTVIFHLTRPDSSFLYELALPWAFVVPADSPRSISRRPLPGTGPYEVDSFRPPHPGTPGARGFGHLVLTRNPRFRVFAPEATPDGYPDRIVATVDVPAAAQIESVERGAADVATSLVDLPRTLVDRLSTRRASQLHSDSLGETEYVFLNTEVPPFDRLAARRAVNELVDRTRLVGLIGGPVGARPTCQILPPDFPGYRPYCPFGANPSPAGTWSGPNLAAARQLVAASRTRGMRVQVWAPARHATVALYFAGLLRRLGYRAVVRIVSGHTGRYYNAVGDPHTRAQIGWAGWIKDYTAPAAFLKPLFSCSGIVADDPASTSNYSSLCDPSLDRQMETAGRLQQRDPVAGQRAWAAIDRVIVDRAAAVPYANDLAITLLSPRTGGYEFNPEWGVLLDQLWVR